MLRSMAPPRRPRGFCRVRPWLVAMLVLLVGTRMAGAITFIRDAEIEHALSALAAPLARAAGLNPNRIRVILVRDDTMNAYVADPGHVFIHTGMMLRLDDPAELQAVIAHELAHIANGHIVRRTANARASGRLAGLGLALGIAVAAGSGRPEAGAGIVAGTASSAERALFAHTRAEEASADQLGLELMSRAGVDPAAAARVLEIFRGQELLSPARQDPYVRTHPLTRDRIRAVEAYAEATKGRHAATSPEATRWFTRARTKLSAFLRNPSWTLRQVAGKDDATALTARAIAYHRLADRTRALAETDRLIALHPKDPYYVELKGQILLESREPGPAAAAYRRAVELAPGEPLIKAGLGRALLALGTASANREALAVLSAAAAAEHSDPALLRDLAIAYSRAGQNALASLATAERYALLGSPKDALLHATRARDGLPEGSRGWRRADDLVRVLERQVRSR